MRICLYVFRFVSDNLSFVCRSVSLYLADEQMLQNSGNLKFMYQTYHFIIINGVYIVIKFEKKVCCNLTNAELLKFCKVVINLNM